MNAPHPSSRSRQKGVITVIAVMLLVTVALFALSQTLNITASNRVDNMDGQDSMNALFLAESGVERGLAILAAASQAGTFTNITCTNLASQPAVSLGAGTFQITSAASYCGIPAAPCSTCGGATPCTACAVTAKGMANAASRFISASLASTSANGVEGYGSTFTLNLKSTVDNSFAFTHLAFNPPSNWDVTGQLGTCINSSPGVSITTCTESWQLQGTAYNNTASQGVFASVPTAGYYSITENTKQNNVLINEDYVQVGVILRPNASGTIAHKGSYTRSTNNTCVASTTYRTMPVTALVGTGQSCGTSDYQHGYLDPNWTCNLNSGTTANWSLAASANFLILGFGGKPYSGGSQRTGKLSNVSLNGQPMHLQVEMVGSQKVIGTGPPLFNELQYSQLWYTYNPDYYSTANANNGAQIVGTIGADFTGAVGGVVRGCIGNSANLSACSGSPSNCTASGGNGTTLKVCSVSSGALRVGDLLSGGSISAGTNITAFGTGTGGTGTYTVDVSQNRDSVTITANSNILRVTAVSRGQLTAGGDVTSGITGSPTIQPFSTSGTTGTGLTGDYVLDTQVAPVNTTSMQASSNVLRLAANTCSSSLSLGDTVISGGSGSGTTYGTLGTLLSGTANQSGALYTLTGSPQYVSTASTTCGSGNANANMHTNSSTVTLASGTTQPSPGTALAVYSGTGAYLPDSVTGSISVISGIPTLNVTGFTGSPNLSVGDALFGANIQPNTTIADPTVSPCNGATFTGTGSTGTYCVTPSQTAASGTVMARPAVLSTPTPTATSFKMSRLPDTALNNARLCGGVCPFLLGDGVHTVGEFDLTGIQDYDDWSSGFACLSGVDPTNIKTIIQTISQRASWTEPPQ